MNSGRRELLLLFLVSGAGIFAQNKAESNEQLMQRAQQEYSNKSLSDAERDFRVLAERLPSNVYVQVYLGQTLFEEQKFREAAGFFERAHQLEKAGSKLSLKQHRIIIDQLAMAYGISGDLKKSHVVLDEAIRSDPEYPMNYYNLACAFAEEDEKGKVLANLTLAFRYKSHVLDGEHMPDPRLDESFQKYAKDEDFIKLMADLGFK
jgi:predicted Zn-dependent protease